MSSPGSCAALPNLGTIGSYKSAEEQCSSDEACSVGQVTANSNSTIPPGGIPVEILNGSASLNGPSGYERYVAANLGQVAIIPPNGFGSTGVEDGNYLEDGQGDWQYGNMVSPHFSVVFQTPPTIQIPSAACTVISNTLTQAGISPILIQQILTQLHCS